MRTDVMYRVEATSSTVEKVALLKTIADDRLTVELLRLALDPYITFGVTMNRETMLRLAQKHLEDDFPVSGGSAYITENMAILGNATHTIYWWEAFILVLNTLSKRGLTGSKAEKAVNDVIAAAPSLAVADWAWRILNKDLRCGVSVTLALKAFPGLVKPFAVAYAHPYRDQELNYDGFIEPKYDGERCVYIRGKAMSRYGLEMPGAHAALTLSERFKDDWVFDGELYKHGTPLNIIHGMASKSAPNDLVYVVFDAINIDEWDVQNTSSFYDRRTDLMSLSSGFGSQVQCTPSEFINSEGVTIEYLLQWRDYWREEGYEGAMWKRSDAKYSFRRTNDVIKLKMFETVDGKIVDMYEGEGKHAGRLGGLVIELPSGVQTRLGGGFSDAQRDEFWQLGSSMFGQYVEGMAQEGKTKNGKLRHGNFVRLRPDKE